jgi:hypothetical protein
VCKNDRVNAGDHVLVAEESPSTGATTRRSDPVREAAS